jgi:hypothetical protein
VRTAAIRALVRRPWMTYVEMIEGVFARYYASSSARPWIKSPEAACDDAIYRMSILIAAPFVLATALLELLFMKVDPTGLLRRYRAVLFTGGFLITSGAVYFALRSMFDSYSSEAHMSRSGVPSELILELVGGACIFGYVVTFFISSVL